MKNFPKSYIWINGRKVSFQAILEKKTVQVSDFEANTFSFIRDWLSGADKFELQTSGSTGNPKIISVTRAQMITSARLTAEALELREHFNALVCLDPRHIAGKMMLVRSMEVGMGIFAIDPCANPLSKIPVDLTIHFTALVPYQAKAILESKHPHMLDTLCSCIIGGGAVEPDLVERLQVYSTKIYSTYGMTETLSHVALRVLNGKNHSDFYQTLPGITVRTDDRSCLIISAPYLDGEIVTNDIAEVTGKNNFRWVGRWDNVINSGGLKISSEILEGRIGQIFTRLEISNSFFIQGIPDEKLGQRVALVMEAPLKKEMLEVIRQEFIHSFSPYEIPKVFFESDSFVYTNTSKINRQESFKTSRNISYMLD